MANRKINPVVKTCYCTLLDDRDKLVTKPHLAMTPQQCKELTDRGIAVSLPNSQFLDGESTGWDVDPSFRRDSDLVSTWEIENQSKSKLIRAHKTDKKKYGN